MLEVNIGSVIWTTIAFLIVMFILSKMAWKPILNALREREKNIEDALRAAEQAREEMQRLEASNRQLLDEARIEKEKILKEAREIREKIIAEAKEKAAAEADRLLSQAKMTIQNEKQAALNELKNQVAQLSIEIAEKIVRQELSSQEKQKDLVNKLVDEIALN